MNSYCRGGCSSCSSAYPSYPSSSGGCSSCRAGCNSCPRSNQSVGVLRYVSTPGALQGCANCASPARPPYRPDQPGYNFPYYTGPCGPCPPCYRCSCKCQDDGRCAGCSACQDRWPDWNGCYPGGGGVPTPAADADCDGAAFLTNAPIAVAAGGTVNLMAQAGNSACFLNTQGGVQLDQAGLYMAVLTVQAPANQAVNSQFYLTLNGQTVSGSSLNVNAPGTQSAQLIFCAQAGDVLLLKSGSAVNLAAGVAAPFMLNLVRIA